MQCQARLKSTFKQELGCAVLLAIALGCSSQENSTPEIDAVIPATVTSQATTAAIIEGAHFYSVAHFDIDNSSATDLRSTYQVSVGNLPSQSAQATDPQHIGFVVPAGLPSGKHAVTVLMPDGQSVTMPDAITVLDDDGLLLSIEDAGTGLGNSANGRKLPVGGILNLHAIGRRDQDFLDGVEVDWDVGTGGALSEEFGSEVVFEAVSITSDTTVSISHPIYGGASIRLSVVECIANADCADPCRSTNACVSDVCVQGPVDRDADLDGAVDISCPGGTDCDDSVDTCAADCTDTDGDTLALCAGDCDDSVATGSACTTGCSAFFADNDGDSFGNPAVASAALCQAPVGFVANGTDCDDNTLACGSSCFPGNLAADICDGNDQDCDAFVDENPELLWFADADGDGFGNALVTTNACLQPAGFVEDDLDCADNPAGDPICGGLNGNFCNPAGDEGPGGDTTCSDNADNDCDGDVDVDDIDCELTTITTTLRFDNTGIGENLTKFPVLVTLTPTNFDYDLADPLGADLLFEDADGITTLPHEIEVWNPGGTSQVWVLALQIDANSTTDSIFMTYGDIGVAPGEDPANLWDLYHAVYHMGESGNGSADEFTDSSPQNHHGQGGTGVPSRVPVPAIGKIGIAQEFDGNDDHVLVAPSADFIFAADAITISTWVSSNSNNNPMVAVGKGGSPGGYRFGIESNGRVGWLVSGTLVDTILAPSEPEFHHIVLNWDGSTMRTYVDGVEEASTTKNGAMLATSDAFFIGRGPSGFEFRGIIDEVRVRNEAMSAAWIAAQHRTTNNTYITFE